jgi:hypothetical protein
MKKNMEKNQCGTGLLAALSGDLYNPSQILRNHDCFSRRTLE